MKINKDFSKKKTVWEKSELAKKIFLIASTVIAAVFVRLVFFLFDKKLFEQKGNGNSKGYVG